MISASALHVGDVLQSRDGDLYRLTRRHTYKRWDADRLNGFGIWIPWGYIADHEIEQSGPDRIWWLDESVQR